MASTDNPYTEGYATTFGYNDPQDNGVGAWGDNTNNPDIVGVSLPIQVLRDRFGDENAAHNKLVEVINPATGRKLLAPIVDKGPGKSALAKGNILDLTHAANKLLGGTGKTQMQYRILGDNENPYDQFVQPQTESNQQDVNPYAEFAQPQQQIGGNSIAPVSNGGGTPTQQDTNPYQEFSKAAPQPVIQSDNPYAQFVAPVLENKTISPYATTQQTILQSQKGLSQEQVKDAISKLTPEQQKGVNVSLDPNTQTWTLDVVGQTPVKPGVGEGVVQGLTAAGARTAGGVADIAGQHEFGGEMNQIAQGLNQNFSQTTPGRIGGAIGQTIPIMTGGGGLAATQAASQAFNETYQQTGSYPDAVKAGIYSGGEMIGYWLTGGAAARAAAPWLRTAGPIGKAVGGGLVSTIANMITSSGIRAIHAQPGERSQAAQPTLESTIQDSLFGLFHGAHTGMEAARTESGVREGLTTAPQWALETAAADPEFRKTSPYNPKLIDEELQRRQGQPPSELPPYSPEVDAIQSEIQQKAAQIAPQTPEAIEGAAPPETPVQAEIEANKPQVTEGGEQRAIQEQIPNEEVLRNEGQGPSENVELSGMGERNAQPEEAAQQGQAKEEVTPPTVPTAEREFLRQYAEHATAEAQNLGPGAANSEEFMQRYATVGASHIINGEIYNFGEWSRAMEKDFGSHIREQLPEIWERSKNLVNEFSPQTEGRSAIQREIEKGTGIQKPPVEKQSVNPVASQKSSLRAAEKAGEAGYKRGSQEAWTKAKEIIGGLKERISNSITKAHGLSEYLRGMQKGSRIGYEAMRKNAKIADKWLAADQEAIRKQMTDYVKAALPPEERGRFIGAITRALRRPQLIGGDPQMMYKNATNVIKAIETRGMEVYKNDLIKNINKVGTRALNSPSVDLTMKQAIRQATSNVGEINQEGLARAQEHLNKLEAKGKPVGGLRAVVDALQQVSYQPLEDTPIGVLENLNTSVRIFELIGRLENKSNKEMWAAEKEQRQSEILNGPGNSMESRPQFKPQPGEKLTFKEKLQNSINRKFDFAGQFEMGHLPQDVMFDMIQDGKGTYSGPIFDHIRTPIDASYDSAQNRYLEASRGLKEIVKKYKLTDQDEDIIGVWAELQQEGGEKRLLDSGVTQETIDKIKGDGLDSRQSKAYDYMRETLDSHLPDVQRTMHELFNMEVKPVENYFPRMRDYEIYQADQNNPIVDTRTGEQISPEMLHSFGMVASDFSPRASSKLAKGFTIERQPNAEGPIRYDAFNVFDRHMYNASRLIDMQRPLKMAAEIVNTPEFAEKFGKQGQQLLKDWITITATDGQGVNNARADLVTGFLKNVLDNQRRAANRGLVFFRLTSNIKHASAIPQGMVMAGGPNYWYRGMKSAFSPEGKAFLENFPQVVQRSAGELSLSELQKQMHNDNFFGKAMAFGDKYGFIIGKEVDALNSRATFIGRYLRNLEEKGKNPSLTGPIDQDAAYNAMTFMRRTVSSTLPKDLQPALVGKGLGGSLSKTLNAFRQFALERYSIMRYDTPQAFKSGNYTRGIGLIVALQLAAAYETNVKHAVSSGFNAIGQSLGLTGPEKEKKDSLNCWQEIAMDNISMVPYMNIPIAAAQWGESGIPVVDMYVNTVKNAVRAYKAKTGEARKGAAIGALGGVAGMAGLPGASVITDTAKKLFVDKTKMKDQERRLH